MFGLRVHLTKRPPVLLYARGDHVIFGLSLSLTHTQHSLGLLFTQQYIKLQRLTVPGSKDLLPRENTVGMRGDRLGGGLFCNIYFLRSPAELVNVVGTQEK